LTIKLRITLTDEDITKRVETWLSGKLGEQLRNLPRAK